MRRIIIHGDVQKMSAKKAIDELPGNGRFEVVIKRHQKPRSVDQNALMWKWLEILGNDLGYSKNEMYDEACRVLLGSETKQSPFTGEEYQRLRTSSGLDKAEFSAFLDDLYRWALNEFNCILPLPEDRYGR